MITDTPMAPAMEFSQEGRAFLDAFYRATKTPLDNTEAKIGALRKHQIKEDMQVTSADGDISAEMELRALEYYVLMENGIEE